MSEKNSRFEREKESLRKENKKLQDELERVSRSFLTDNEPQWPTLFSLLYSAGRIHVDNVF